MSDEKRRTRRRNMGITKQKENLTKGNAFSEVNKCFVIGRIEAEFEYSHETFGEKFYQTRVRVERLSGTEDLVPIVVSDLLIGRKKIKTSLKGKWVEVEGQFRSHNKLGEDGRSHLELFLFARMINIHEDEDELEGIRGKNNQIYLDGYLGKPPVFRKTADAKRQLTELFIGVNRAYGKSDYIPCIVWGRSAVWASEFKVGTRVQIYGRVQSRTKRFGDVYEISVTKIQEV